MFRTFLGGHLRASCGCLAYRRSPYIYGRSIISVRPLSSPSSQLPIISLHYDQLAAGHTTFIRWEAAAGKVAWVRTRRPEMYATLGDRVASLARYVRIYTTYVDRGSAGPTRSRLRGRSFRALGAHPTAQLRLHARTCPKLARTGWARDRRVWCARIGSSICVLGRAGPGFPDSPSLAGCHRSATATAMLLVLGAGRCLPPAPSRGRRIGWRSIIGRQTSWW